jgi:hypothetical protein
MVVLVVVLAAGMAVVTVAASMREGAGRREDVQYMQ